MIKKHGEWVLTEAIFIMDGKEDFANLGLKEYDVLETSPIRFRLDRLESYNKGPDSRPTTILLESGDIYSLNVPFKEFDEFILKEKE